MTTTEPMAFYGFSNVDISKQIVVTGNYIAAGISRAGQTISVYHGDTLIADCTMPSTGIADTPTVVVGELTLHDETFTGFVEGETYTIVAGDEPPITGFVKHGGLISFDYSALWCVLANTEQGRIKSTDESNTRTNYTISQKITTTKKRYDIKRLPEELLPKTVATKAEVRKAQTSADAAKVRADDAYGYADSAWENAAAAQSTADAAQSTAETAQSTAETAQSTAETVQSTAETAQTTAETAKSTAASIKPNWNEKDNSKPGYIANRPFYHDITTAYSINHNTGQANILIDGTELYWSDLVGASRSLQIYGDKTYMLYATSEKFTPVRFRSDFSYSYALGNPRLIKAILSNAETSDGEELPDTGGDWVYYNTPGSSTYVTISKTKNWQGMFAEILSEDLKLLDEKFIPTSIQRTGGDVFLHSSTPDSTKQFKITVDDSGVISATEVE